jgi:hypothetical protein
LQFKILLHFMAVWTVLQPLGIFCCHLVCLMVIWFIFSRFGTLYQEKSGNPGGCVGGRVRQEGECGVGRKRERETEQKVFFGNLKTILSSRHFFHVFNLFSYVYVKRVQLKFLVW